LKIEDLEEEEEKEDENITESTIKKAETEENELQYTLYTFIECMLARK